jgi:arylsulfatase A-like enzyme
MPNVVLIVLDTVRASHVSFMGYARDTTPFLRSLARDASVFSRAIASSNMTLPTHASLLTGQYARRHGAHYQPPEFSTGRPVADAIDTLAERLAAKGYRTAAVVANQWYLDDAWGMAQGFEAYDDRHYLGLTSPGNVALLAPAIAQVAPWALPRDSWRDFRRGDEITRAGLTLIDDFTAARAPFFLFLNYMDAHHPYLPPAPFDARFEGRDDAVSLFEYDRLARAVMRKHRGLTGAERDALLSQYDGAIAYVDDQIRIVAERLESAGQLDNTLFIVTSDHGETFGEHSLIGHGLSTTLEQTAVPLLVRFPRDDGEDRAGAEVSAWASHVDIVPTALAAAGLPLDAELDGVDLATLTNDTARAVVSEAFQSPYYADVSSDIGRPETALFFGTHKLVVRHSGDHLLFDLSQDPGESSNVRESDHTGAARLDAQLQAWLDRVPRFDARGSRPDQRTMDRLKSLGYVR